MNKRKGQSANPRGSDNLRSIQIVLNKRYLEETTAVETLDAARSSLDSNGNPYSDRYIINEALNALREKYPDLNVPPPKQTKEELFSAELVDNITQAIMDSLGDLIDTGANVQQQQQTTEGQHKQRRDSLRKTIKAGVNSAIATENMVGDSYKWVEEDDD